MSWVAIILITGQSYFATAEVRVTSLGHCWARIAQVVVLSRADTRSGKRLALALCKPAKGAIEI